MTAWGIPQLCIGEFRRQVRAITPCHMATSLTDIKLSRRPWQLDSFHYLVNSKLGTNEQGNLALLYNSGILYSILLS